MRGHYAEIDKVLKKVAEGVETFEEIFDKIQTSTNTNQKEKYEADLKKEIKKLQRHRDQIKTWISSNDIKDKRALMDNRKLIEQQMEKFKACEKEMKTKAYSKEGLSMSARLDPKEKEKADLCGWVNDRVEALNIQIEGLEAEVETLQSGAKKKKDPSRERIIELEEKIERHKWHQGRLELILRLLENGQIDMEKVQAIQEDVNYYVDENTDPDFAEDEEIYEDLNLEEEEEFFGGVTPSAAAKDAEKDEFHDDFEKPSKDHKDEHEQPKPSMSEKDTKPTSTPTPTFVTKPTGTPVRPGPAPRTMSVDAPAVQYAAAAAANLPTESPKVTNATVVAASPKVTSAVASSTPIDEKPPSAPSSTIKSPITSAAATAAIVTPAAPTLPETQAASPQAATQTTSVAPTLADFKAAKEETSSAKETPSASAAPSPTVVLQEKAEGSPTLETATALQDAPQPQLQHSTPALEPAPAPASVAALGTAPVSQQQSQLHQPSTVESEIRLPAALADLAHSFEASKERALSKEMGFFVHQMLEASYQFVPEPMDTERPKFYQPKNPYPTPSYYPQSPPQGLFDSAAMFEKFDIDTLFFIFYYQQGTYQQYLAARELKKRSWRFHKNYLTWFQRHEEPKAITDDYEQGTYIYFDYEGAWCQRKKSDFRFEYKFLEDAELI
ncbi:general negative regulator of transcription subunit 5 [Actinomortierella ambigua]|uniref:General negative regulator of transcription subunit n=1 Tax=Actinomortierella ambigua TaxID=1343610 RepID=A0A9P6QMF2_9FUNG|nr:general negative regulator of transcription subunit 5 [Actinomortierella ambigua]